MKKWIGPLCLLCLIQACIKNDDSKKELSGYLVHAVTKQPIPGEEVQVRITLMTLGAKSEEFPNGMPIYTERTYKNITDAAGKYHFLVDDTRTYPFPVYAVTNKNWVIAYGLHAGGPYRPGPNDPILSRKHDTIFVEKPGYIQYEINNINDRFDNDSLYVATNYNPRTWKYPSGQQPGPFVFLPSLGRFNWLFAGKDISRTFTDTVAAESRQQVEVEWAYKRTDTLKQDKAFIPVSPGTITNYKIEY
jgi:hypothetical protein